MKLHLTHRNPVTYPVSIGEAAALLGISTSTLRVYERLGVVAPARAGRNRSRLYLPQDLAAIKEYRKKLISR
jgi:DNA-binding transcriptional MerR regulator